MQQRGGCHSTNHSIILMLSVDCHRETKKGDALALDVEVITKSSPYSRRLDESDER